MIRKVLRSLLPAYTNGTLHPLGRKLIFWWLTQDSIAREEYHHLVIVRNALKAQPVSSPSSDVLKRIQATTGASSVLATPISKPQFLWKSWAAGMTLILLSFFLLWYVLPPGVVLQWTTHGEEPVAFRIYRAADPSQGFELLDEISTNNGVTSLDARVYTYRDIILFPGQEYVYRVEMIDHNGLTFSQTIMSNAEQALPGQLAVLFALLIVFYGISLALPTPTFFFRRITA
ncbi:MAG TPA: hypothetical protein PK530_01915 [Anaerolineales bacterium]|nr:hypothetical protein [Anaerolineales bacterium]